ncbi:protein SOSEKI 5 [Solanum lycopersicum]|uniref:protein SOSEKI 5 n=1 Tax=Solanum lycopersicum TaxID=4081 RepID=UPI003749C25A
MATFVRAKDQKWKDRETSNKVWIENQNHKLKSERKVPVVYYLTRNGQLEHPHFMEVTLSSPDEGLYLRDVINRLNFLRGKGIASLYSWSAKRSYRNGFVWHDLADHDFIYPAHGQEYVLKGSQLVEGATTLTSKNQVPEVRKLPAVSRRRNQSWCSADFHEYRVYKAESSSNEYSGKAGADASTQTDDRRRRRREIGIGEEEEEEVSISPPPSDSSPETLETLMKADGKVIVRPETDESNGKSRGSSSVLMQLLWCGSMSFKDCGPGGYGKDHGLSHYKSRVPRGPVAEISRRVEHQGITKLEEYLSGSLIETNKDEYPALKRSSSWNADGSAKLEIREKEIERVRAKCIPTRPKNQSSRKELGSSIHLSSSSSTQQGSKRLVLPPQL